MSRRHARSWDLDPESDPHLQAELEASDRLSTWDMCRGPAGEVVSPSTFKRHKLRGLVPKGKPGLNGITYSAEDHSIYWTRVAVHRDQIQATRLRNVKTKVGPRGTALQQQRRQLYSLVDRVPVGLAPLVEQAVREVVSRSGQFLRRPMRRHPHSLS